MTNADIWVLVADAAKARCLSLLEEDEPGSERVVLREDKTWVHPEARVVEHERYDDSKPIGHHGGSAGQTHPFDDHRDAHDEDERRRFANLVADGVARLVGEKSPARLVICSSHAMSSLLTQAWERNDLARLRTDWVTAEVSERSPHALHEYLAERGMLPAPKAPRVQR